MRAGRALLLGTVFLGVLGASAGGVPRPAAADFGKDEEKFDNAAYPPEFRNRVVHAILSSAQYALLGLKAADRCGLKVPLDVWRASLQFLLGSQDADGPEVELRGNEVRGDYRIEWKEKAKARGFHYSGAGKTPATGSMT